MSAETKSRKLRVGVLRGGPSNEYEVSLRTGQNILDAIRENERFLAQDVFIDRDGHWHIEGVKRPIERILPHIDVVVNGLHGTFGEDGEVQRLLDRHKVPYTGSGHLASSAGMNKPYAKKFFKLAGLLTPEHLLVSREDDPHLVYKRIEQDFPFMKIVKPATAGSSIGIGTFRDRNQFILALDSAFEHSDLAMIEEYVRGREATCVVIESANGDSLSALHPVEIKNLTDNRDFWNYESKYSDEKHELVCPGDFSIDEDRLIRDYAIRAHKALGLRHYSRSDFIITRHGIYILEVNTLPALTSTSLLPKSLSVAGLSIGDFVEHIIELALKR